jgi:TolB-like protein
MKDVRSEDTRTFSDPIAPLRSAVRDRYDVGRQIGQGAFATVYVARDLKHDRQVAIKVLNANPGSGMSELRFIREIGLLARLQHPNILPLHDSGHVDSLLYYVMPFVSGETLRDRIVREKRLPPDAACTIAKEVADALAYAHDQGIIHRDIKPENILLSAGHPVLADFGIAHLINVSGVRQLTGTGRGGAGTPAYMSPEQLIGDRDVDGRSDIYSLGCVLYEMLVGTPPFAGKDEFIKRLSESAPKVSRSLPNLSPWLDDVVAKSLELDPHDRYVTANEFVSALSSPQREGARAMSRLARQSQMVFHRVAHSGWTAVAAIALTLALALAIVVMNRQETPDPPAGTGTPPTIIAVTPFRTVPNDKTTEFLREGMVDLLSSTFTGDSNWRVVDPALILRASRNRGGGAQARLDSRLTDIIGVGRDVGATRVISGAVVGTPSSLIFTAFLIDVPSGSSVGEVQVSGSIDSLPVLVDRLAAELMGVHTGERDATVSVLTGTPLTAVRAYLAGRTAFRRSEYEKAVRLQETALQIDSTFALAAIDLARTAGWLGNDDARLRAYKLAWTNQRRLGPADRVVLKAVLGPRYPEGSTRREWLHAWERVAALQPDRPEGWWEVGDLYFHNPWLAGGDEDEGLKRARVLMARALQQGPTYWPAFQHVVQLAAHFGDSVALRQLSRQASAGQLNSDLDYYIRWRVATALDDQDSLRILRRRMDRAGSLVLGWISMTSQQDGLPLADARHAADVQLARAGTEPERIDALQAYHALALNEGRISAAMRVVASMQAAQERSTIGAQLAVVDVIFAGAPLDSVTLHAGDSLESSLARLPRETRDWAATTVVGKCLLGHWYTMRQQPVGVSRSISELRDLGTKFPKELSAPEANTCALLLDASLVLERGDPRSRVKLDSLDAVLTRGPYMTSQLLWDVTVLAAARLFEKAGDLPRARAAVRRRNSFGRIPVLLAPHLLATARLSLAMGDRRAAMHDYEHYLALRDNPDPSLMAERRAAELALESLKLFHPLHRPQDRDVVQILWSTRRFL